MQDIRYLLLIREDRHPYKNGRRWEGQDQGRRNSRGNPKNQVSSRVFASHFLCVEWPSEARKLSHLRLHALRSLLEPRTKATKPRDQFASQPRFWKSPPVRVLVVRVQRPGTDSRWESTRESLIFTAHQALSRKSLISESIQA